MEDWEIRYWQLKEEYEVLMEDYNDLKKEFDEVSQELFVSNDTIDDLELRLSDCEEG